MKFIYVVQLCNYWFHLSRKWNVILKVTNSGSKINYSANACDFNLTHYFAFFVLKMHGNGMTDITVNVVLTSVYFLWSCASMSIYLIASIPSVKCPHDITVRYANTNIDNKRGGGGGEPVTFGSHGSPPSSSIYNGTYILWPTINKAYSLFMYV